MIHVASVEKARQKWPKKRSLPKVNEYFEVIFNNAFSSAAINQGFH